MLSKIKINLSISKFRLKGLISLCFIIILVIAGFFMFNKPEEVVAGWWNDSWNYRKAITINHTQVVGDLTDFPMLVSLTDTNLGANAQADGDDIIFINTEGQKLSHEIESFASSTGKLVAWVKMPTISSTQDEVIYMYYGNGGVASQEDTENVWDENFVMVQHMNEIGSGERYDSTSNNLDGAPLSFEGNEATSTGMINGAVDMGGNDTMAIASSTKLDNLGALTISTWIKVSAEEMMMIKDSSFIFGWGLFNGIYFYDQTWNSGDGEWQTTYELGYGNWRHVAVVYSATSTTDVPIFYIDGVATTTVTTNTPGGTRDLSSQQLIVGSIYSDPSAAYDETRISSAIRSAAWIKTEYNNQNTPSTFLTAAAQETGPGPVGYWSFDEGFGTTAHDESGQRSDGAINGATWVDESQCISGKCLYFDGTNDYVSVVGPGNDSLNFGTNDFSISFWLKTSSTIQVVPVISKGFFDTASWMVMLNSMFLAFSAYDNEFNSMTSIGDLSIDSNTWYNISFTVDRNDVSGLKTYVNGYLVGVSDPTLLINDSISTTSPFYIGTNHYFPAFFEGFIDEVKIYPYARTADQVKQDYAAGLAGVGSNSGVAASFGGGGDKWLSDGLVGYWKFDEENTATSFVDSSNNSRTLTANGNASTTAGKFGRGGIFDGVGDSDINNNQLDQIKTVSFWINADDLTSREIIYFLNDAQSTSIEIDSSGNIVTTANYPSAIIYIDGVRDDSLSSGWHHIVVTAQIGMDIANGLSIGGITNYYDGRIDDVRVYNRAFSAGEVVKLYEWAPSAVAHWKFDEKSGTTTIDHSGNQNNGEFASISTSPTWTRGKFGGALSFDGTNDRVVVASSSSLNLGGGMSLGMWVKLGGTAEFNMLLKGWDGYSGTDNVYLMIDNYGYSELIIRNNINGTFATRSVYKDWELNRWYYVGYTYDGAYERLYLDGVQIGSWAKTGSVKYVANDIGMIIGNGYSSIEQYFNGVIDDVRIYNYARTPKQIAEDMNGGKAAGPAVHWSFDEGYGSTVHDDTDRGYDGSISGITVWKNEGCISGGCLEFDGEGGSVMDSDGETAVAGLTAASISVWVRSNLTGVDRGIVDVYSTTLVDRGMSMRYDAAGGSGGGTNVIKVAFGGTSGDTVVSHLESSSGAQTTDWQHLVATWVGGEAPKLYINGVLDTPTYTSSLGTAIGSSITDIRAGYDVGYGYWDGLMDELQIFGYELTQDDVDRLYNAGKAGVRSKSGSATAMGGQSSSWLTDGLVGHWKMDELTTAGGAIDSSGMDNNGTYNGHASTTGAKFGRGGVFDGSGDYISITETDYEFDSPDSFSIFLWVKSTDSANTLIGNIDNSNIGYQIYNQGSSWNVDLTNVPTTNAIDKNGQTDISDGNWHHVGFTYNGSLKASGLNLYVDGELDNGIVDADSLVGDITDPNFFTIGSRNTGASPTEGQIDEVRVYNRALSPDEVRKLYEWAPGPVLHMKLDEKSGATAYDTSGNGFSGSITGALWGRGKFGSALSFDGVNDYVDISNNTIIDSFLDNAMLTASFWVKINDLSQTGQVFLGYGTAPADSCYLRYLNDGTLRLYQWYPVGGAEGITTTNTYITDNDWHHVSWIINGYDHDLYFDGKYIETLTSTKNISNYASSYFIRVGANFGGGNPLNGQIDDLKTYDYVRTPAQIAQDYNGGKPIAHYRFDECQGSVIHDESGNGYHGQLILGTAGVTATGTCAQSASSFWYNGRSGKYNSAGSFDGGSDYVSFGDLPDSVAQEGSIGIWIKRTFADNVSQEQAPVFMRRTANNGNYVKLKYDDDDDLWHFATARSFTAIDLSFDADLIPQNEWTQALMTWSESNDKAKIYINGDLVSQATFTATWTGDVGELYVSNDLEEVRYYTGYLDDFKVWNYALTADQVRNEYNGGAVRFGN